MSYNPNDKLTGAYLSSPHSQNYAPKRMKTVKVNQDTSDHLQKNDQGDDDKKEKSFWASAVEFLAVLVSAFFIAYAIRFFVFEIYVVPTGSMLQTIQEQDMLVGEKLTLHFKDPEVGEIVTFRDPIDPNKVLIKRLIANEGSTVDLKNGYVYVDGVKIAEPYVSGQITEPEANASNLGLPISYPYTVPEGYVWVMGDNRGNSLDSRAFGPVQKSAITSRALWIIWPFKDVKML